MLKKITLKVDSKKLIAGGFIVALIATNMVTIKHNFSIKNVNTKLINEQKTNIALITSQNDDITVLKEKLTEERQSQLVQFTDFDLLKDINKMYPHISTKVKETIVKTILSESKKYNINPLIIYSLIHTESTMRPWIEHKRVLININGKKKYIQAVGLGGIVWEWWGKQLKEANIAEVRSDLFDPVVNIKAVVFVYNTFYLKKKHKKADTQDESAMIRYFGGGYKSYFNKIDSKVAQLIRTKMYRPTVNPIKTTKEIK